MASDESWVTLFLPIRGALALTIIGLPGILPSNGLGSHSHFFLTCTCFFHDMSHFKLWKLFPIWVDELFGFLLWDSLLLIVIGLSGCRPPTVHFVYHLGNL